MSFKKVGYWCSVILPVLDFLRYFVDLFIDDVRELQEIRQYLEEAKRFERDNRPSVGFDVDMSKFDVSEIKLKENKENKENGETV